MDIRIIVNYFGTPPKVFPLWIDSCGANPLIKWIFYTDIDCSRVRVPANMKIVQTDFAQLKQKIQTAIPFPVRYERPWDFYALKPLIPAIFAQELAGADFWGWSDIDMIYGDLTPVVELARQGYDKVMPNGHFSIVRNSAELTRFILSHPCTLQAVASDGPGLSCYDERDFRFTVLREFGARQASEIVPYIHLYPRWGHFSFNVSKAASRLLGLGEDGSCPVLFTWKQGHLIGHFLTPDRSVRQLELAYVHFFKRDIPADVNQMKGDGTVYLIEPTGIREWSSEQLSRNQIRWINRPRLHWKYIRDRLNVKTFRRKILQIFKLLSVRQERDPLQDHEKGIRC